MWRFSVDAFRSSYRTAIPLVLTVVGWAAMWAAALGLLGKLPTLIPAAVFLAGLGLIPLMKRNPIVQKRDPGLGRSGDADALPKTLLMDAMSRRQPHSRADWG